MNRTILLFVLVCLSCSSCKFLRTYRYTRSAFKQYDQGTLQKPFALPFVYKKDWIFLRLKVKQKDTVVEGDFLFDTGAFTYLFDSTGSFEVETPNALELPVTGALGNTKRVLRFAENVELEFGDLKTIKRRILVDDRPGSFPRDCIGMIGLDFFQNCLVQLNFASNKIEVFPKGSAIADSRVLAFNSSRGRKPILKNLNLGSGVQEMNFLLDLGAKSSILIQEKDAAALKGKMGDSVRSYAIGNVGLFDASGLNPESHYYVKYSDKFNGEACPEFEIAGLVNPNDRLHVPNLGLGFMKQVFRRICFDVPGGKFYYQLKREAGPVNQLNREIYISDSDSSKQFTTGPILTTSSWYLQGIRPGQVVLRVNGEQPGNYIRDRKAGKGITVTSLTIQTREGARTFSRNQ